MIVDILLISFNSISSHSIALSLKNSYVVNIISFVLFKKRKNKIK